MCLREARWAGNSRGLGVNSRVGSWAQGKWVRGVGCGMGERHAAGEQSGSRTHRLCRRQGRGGAAFPDGAVFVGLPGLWVSTGLPSHFAPLLWPTLESEKGGEHLGPRQVQILITY